METLSAEFYLTGGTALSRAYLNHRYSDDLDFFVNNISNFKAQIEIITKALDQSGLKFQVIIADDGFVRISVFDEPHVLKLDFVNDITYRNDVPVSTKLYPLTDTPINILSNKITALSRFAAKDVVDIVYIAKSYLFNWPQIMSDASQKDMWINPIEAAKILDEFPVHKLDEIIWVDEIPDPIGFESQLRIVIKDIIDGNQNSLYNV